MKKKRIWASVFLMALFLLSFEDKAFGQGCFDQCQQRLSICLQAAQGDPEAEAQCQRNYDKCAADCMYQSAARKGDKSKVKAVTGSFVFREHQARMIEKVEVGYMAKMYNHSCTVEGLLFPLIQRVYFGSQLNMSWFSKEPSSILHFLGAMSAARRSLRC